MAQVYAEEHQQIQAALQALGADGKYSAIDTSSWTELLSESVTGPATPPHPLEDALSTQATLSQHPGWSGRDFVDSLPAYPVNAEFARRSACPRPVNEKGPHDQTGETSADAFARRNLLANDLMDSSARSLVQPTRPRVSQSGSDFFLSLPQDIHAEQTDRALPLAMRTEDRRPSVGTLLNSRISQETQDLMSTAMKQSGGQRDVNHEMQDVIRARRMLANPGSMH